MKRRPSGYIINEANDDRHAGRSNPTKPPAPPWARNYDNEDLSRCQPAIGMVRDNGTVTYEL